MKTQEIMVDGVKTDIIVKLNPADKEKDIVSEIEDDKINLDSVNKKSNINLNDTMELSINE